ncbi:MAG: ABC transporter substrate-binding protein [Candidatus Rokubacteria bacterium]|nr:ABC transporter substrate-binding protein [Candidatus Rokubacteria bacterium]
MRLTKIHLSPRGEGSACSPLLLALLVLALGGASVAGAAQERAEEGARPGAGGVYRRPLGNDPATLDPARVSDIYSRSVSQQIFDGLVQFDQTLTVMPALAQFWKASRDGLTWTFTLRKGVRFHHGREVTADDVVYSFTRILDPREKSGAADLFGTIQGAQEFREGRARTVSGLTALDRYTVQVVLKEAQAPFVSVLAVGHAKIVPREVVERAGEAFGAQPVGTGPFKFVRWERGKEIVLAVNPDYFGGVPQLARVVYRIFPGERFETMHEEFQKGNLEDTPIPTQDYRRIVASGGSTYVKRPMISVRFYGFNTRWKPLDDRRVRQALAHAIDRDGLIDEVFLGRYTPARGVLPPGTQGFNPRLRGYAYDPERARDLLAQAGYPGGRGLPSIPVWSSVKLERVLQEHELMKKQLEVVGVRTEFHYLTDWPAFFKKLLDGQLPMFVLAWYADVPDPDNFLFKLFHSRSPRNFFGYANATVDELVTAARQVTDPQRRVDLYRRAEQLIVDDAPLVPFWHYTYERLFQPYVRSVEVNGLGDPYIPLRKIWLGPKR